MICNQCFTSVPDDTVICNVCGAKLGEAKEIVPPSKAEDIAQEEEEPKVLGIRKSVITTGCILLIIAAIFAGLVYLFMLILSVILF